MGFILKYLLPKQLFQREMHPASKTKSRETSKQWGSSSQQYMILWISLHLSGFTFFLVCISIHLTPRALSLIPAVPFCIVSFDDHQYRDIWRANVIKLLIFLRFGTTWHWGGKDSGVFLHRTQCVWVFWSILRGIASNQTDKSPEVIYWPVLDYCRYTGIGVYASQWITL